MEPKKFDGVNCVYGANQPEYQDLHAQRYNGPLGQVVTCWQLSPEELQKVQETGEIWLSLLTFGNPLQPVMLTVEKPDKYVDFDE